MSVFNIPAKYRLFSLPSLVDPLKVQARKAAIKAAVPGAKKYNRTSQLRALSDEMADLCRLEQIAAGQVALRQSAFDEAIKQAEEESMRLLRRRAKEDSGSELASDVFNSALKRLRTELIGNDDQAAEASDLADDIMKA